MREWRSSLEDALSYGCGSDYFYRNDGIRDLQHFGGAMNGQVLLPNVYRRCRQTFTQPIHPDRGNLVRVHVG